MFYFTYICNTKQENMETAKKLKKSETPLSETEIKSLPKKAQKIINKLDEDPTDEEEEATGGIIHVILSLHLAGVPKSFIVRLGFNKSTVYRQVRELEKLKKAPALSYMGFELYEARVQKLMKAKNITREKAVEVITNKDLES